MLVHLHQYKHEEVQFDDNRTTGESQTEDTVEREPEEYFGDDLELDADTWETVEFEGDPVQRRKLTIDEVTAVSVSADPEEGDGDLPGETVQVRRAGGVEHLDNAVFVEAEDTDPQ